MDLLQLRLATGFQSEYTSNGTDLYGLLLFVYKILK